MPPLFTSFADAWEWFIGGGTLVAAAAHREAFTAGRAQFLSFQAPAEGSALFHLIDDLEDELGDNDGLRFSPPEHLHISIRALGWQVIEARRPDDVLRQDVGAIAERAAKLLRDVRRIDGAAGPVNVFPDALILEVHDEAGLGQIRTLLSAVRADDALGLDAAQYLPHITVATFDAPGIAAALRERLPAMRGDPAIALRIGRVELARWWFTGTESEHVDRDIVRAYRLRR